MIQKGGTSDAERVAFGFRLCTARLPSQTEKSVLGSTLARLREQYGRDTAAATKLIGIGESKPDPQIDRTELAAYTGLATLLLNMDETMTKE